MDGTEKIFKALADTTRLRIVNLLLGGELCICEMQEILALPQPLVSRHVSYLRNAGLVKDRREGNRTYCSLQLPADEDDALRRFLEGVFRRSEPFRRDSAERRKRVQRVRAMEELIQDSGRPAACKSSKEKEHANQSVAL